MANKRGKGKTNSAAAGSRVALSKLELRAHVQNVPASSLTRSKIASQSVMKHSIQGCHLIQFAGLVAGHSSHSSSSVSPHNPSSSTSTSPASAAGSGLSPPTGAAGHPGVPPPPPPPPHGHYGPYGHHRPHAAHLPPPPGQPGGPPPPPGAAAAAVLSQFYDQHARPQHFPRSGESNYLSILK